MKNRICRFITLLLAGALALGLVACGKEEPVEPSITHTELMNMMKRSIESELDQVIRGIDWAAHGDRIWVCGYQAGDFSRMEQMELWVASVNADGSNVSAMQLHLEPDPALVKQKVQLVEKNPALDYQLVLSLESILFDSTGSPRFILCERLMATGADAGAAAAQQYTLCSLSANGTLRRDAVLQWPQDVAVDVQGAGPLDYVLADDAALWVNMSAQLPQGDIAAGCYLRFDTADGSCTAKLELPAEYRGFSNRNAMRPMPDGSVLVYAGKETGACALFTIDGLAQEQPTLSAPIPLVVPNVEGFVTTLDGVPAAQVLIRAAAGIYQCDVKTGAAQLLTGWDFYGILQDQDPTRAMFYYPQKVTLQFLRIADKSGMTVLSVIDEDELAKLPSITVAAMDDELKRAIYAYNAAGNDYYVKAVDYSFAAAAAAGFTTPAQMLHQAIVSGTAPDVLPMNSVMDTPSLARKGLFLDLYPYIDADPEMTREDFLTGILSASEMDGTLPTVILNYSLVTAVGDSDVVGPDMGWTWDEFNALIAQYPDASPFFNQSRNIVLLYMLQMGGSRFIDSSTGTAYLDSPAFVALLEHSAKYPAVIETDDNGNITQNPKIVFAQRESLVNHRFLTNFYGILLDEFEFDGPVTYKGYPTDDGGVGSAVLANIQVGINSNCKNPDAAWSFVRTLLLPEHQKSIWQGFPLRRDTLQAAAEFAQLPTEINVPVPAYLARPLTKEQEEYFYQGISSQQAQQLVALLEATDTLYRQDINIVNILFEEAGAYYSGVHTAEEAAAIIQNRVQTYLDEQG